MMPPSNSCFFLYASRQISKESNLALFKFTTELSLEAIPISEFNALIWSIFNLDFSPTDKALSPQFNA